MTDLKRPARIVTKPVHVAVKPVKVAAKPVKRAVQNEKVKVASSRTTRDRRDKVRIHLTLITCGSIVAVLIHVWPFLSGLEPVSEMFPFAPSALQELIDWMLGL